MPDDDPPASEQLVARVLAGDRQAFAALVQRHQRALFRLAGNLLPAADVEDVVQDVLLAAWDRLPSFDPGRGRFSTWLLAIARHRCLDALRARRPAGAPTAEPAHRQGPEHDALRRELHGRLDRAFAALPVDQRTAFVLAEIQGLSYAEVAALEGVPLGTVRSRIARARQRLRAVLPAPTERLP